VNDYRAHNLFVLRFAPYALICSAALSFVAFAALPMTARALGFAALGGVWLFLVVALEMRTGWWLGFFGVFGCLAFFKAASKNLHGDFRSSMADLLLIGPTIVVEMGLLLIFRRMLRRYAETLVKSKALSPETGREHSKERSVSHKAVV
jgi:hypothetical protein